jgi:uncharacterized membrane protein YfcA
MATYPIQKLPLPHMDLVIIAIAAAFASLLTFFSGFGLGTLLMPVFALFFPVDIAIALTGLVHLVNNLFKWTLVYRHINWPVVFRFGIPAVPAAFAGAWALIWVNRFLPLLTWHWGEKSFEVTPVKLLIGLLLLVFALLETSPRFSKWQVGAEKMVYGGLLSGFFGGLSGHQGALRTVFLIRAGLSKEAFIATGVMIACLIDLTRLSLYANNFRTISWDSYAAPVLTGILAAFAGGYAGNRLLKKTTMKQVQFTVSVLLGIIALALITGIV